MNLKEAKEFAKLEMGKAPVVVVTSDKAVYLLQNEDEIKVVKNHSDLNKLQMFVVKPSEEKEIVSEVVTEVVAKEDKPKKKK